MDEFERDRVTSSNVEMEIIGMREENRGKEQQLLCHHDVSLHELRCPKTIPLFVSHSFFEELESLISLIMSHSFT